MDDAHEGPIERQLAPQVAVDEDKAGVVRPGGSLPELLQQVVDDARRLLEVDVTIVYLAEPTEDPPHWTYDSGLSPQAHEDSWRQPIDLHGGMTGLALSTGRVIVTQDYANDDRFWDPERRRLNAEHLGTTSVVSVPMYGAAGPLGAFCVFDRRHRGFSEFELALLRALAAHAAVAIENARLGRVLAAAEARYRFLVERSPDAIWSIDATGAFTFVNLTSEQLTGWRAEELIGRDYEMVHHRSTDEEIHRQLALQRSIRSRRFSFGATCGTATGTQSRLKSTRSASLRMGDGPERSAPSVTRADAIEWSESLEPRRPSWPQTANGRISRRTCMTR